MVQRAAQPGRALASGFLDFHGAPPKVRLASALLRGRAMKLQVHVRMGIDGVQAYCPAIPGCSATGRDEAEALRVLQSRIARCFAPIAAPVPGTRVVQIEV
jgi:hypothetical protein